MRRKFFSIDDARLAAKKRMPRMMFDFVDGAASDEHLKWLNTASISHIRLQPRALVNVEQRNLSIPLFERTWNLPFGIAPMGMCNLTWPGTDIAFAEAATHYNIPLCLSTAASTSIEDMQKSAGDNLWFQLYVGQSEEMAQSLVRRADHAGLQVLVLTVDVPQVSPRPRDLRNGFQTPLRIGPKQFFDFARHPRWSLSTLSNGIPRTANFSTDAGNQAFVRQESRGRVDWPYLDRLRDAWPRKLVVKGVMSPDDAVRIRDAGADAIYVSNHGGRQLNSAPAAIHMLPRIRDVVGDEYPLIFDSGIRNGEGIVKALALGADMVMLGRPFLYAMGGAGKIGVARIIDLLTNEISLTIAQIGRPKVADIDRSVIAEDRYASLPLSNLPIMTDLEEPRR